MSFIFYLTDAGRAMNHSVGRKSRSGTDSSPITNHPASASSSAFVLSSVPLFGTAPCILLQRLDKRGKSAIVEGISLILEGSLVEGTIRVHSLSRAGGIVIIIISH
jgi:hypothetical protein